MDFALFKSAIGPHNNRSIFQFAGAEPMAEIGQEQFAFIPVRLFSAAGAVIFNTDLSAFSLGGLTGCYS
jgi:hypothetical protein